MIFKGFFFIKKKDVLERNCLHLLTQIFTAYIFATQSVVWGLVALASPGSWLQMQNLSTPQTYRIGICILTSSLGNSYGQQTLKCIYLNIYTTYENTPPPSPLRCWLCLSQGPYENEGATDSVFH